MNAPENDEQRTGLSYRWVIFLILAMGYAIVYFHRVAPAVVVPELTRSFRIKGVAVGVLASAYFYPYALMQLLRQSCKDRRTFLTSFYHFVLFRPRVKPLDQVTEVRGVDNGFGSCII